MDYAWNPIELKWLKTDKFVTNPWNPNRMSQANRAKLLREVKEKGFVAPVVARPFHGRYQIIDGEHRLQIARELKLPRLPAVIVPLSDAEARIKTLQLNRLRGEDDPERLAELLAQLLADQDPQAMSRRLPWSESEITQMIALIEKETENELRRAVYPAFSSPPELTMFVLVVTAEQKAEIEAAVQAVKSRHGEMDDGRALLELVRAGYAG